ncbi:T9SS type A sorting domain-containing protein [Psychroserpens sp. Hel_I_66]|uniref:T9SS type A sorting domain-containing protein n=1 Tax=Psychroserpens sp. Hel_I_66 TaxID=1250004 RepID=UPI00064682C6|nr:T9SS type A sorting domain-containing protein [Psychroserpens sp. Hel_I_66]
MKNTLLLTLAISALLCFSSNAQDLATTMTVKPGTPVFVSSGTTLDASNINLKSTSSKFSCLLLNGTLGTSNIVNYDRYINVVGVTGVNGGNDLISLPVKASGDVTFADLLGYSADAGLTTNADIIVNSTATPTLFLFGPYSNTTSSYFNYDQVAEGSIQLKSGVGYRAASNNGETIRFTGTTANASETVTITTANNNSWNLIGNPYPTYMDSQAFLAENSDKLDPNATAIYGYNSGSAPTSGTIDNFTIINNLVNSNVNIAPGQGFLVANHKDSISNPILYTPAMRTISGTDDFILNRDANPNQMLRLRVDNATANYATEIYFNENSTLSLDPGYDAELYGGANSSLMVYSRLVENNVGRNMAIQSLGFVALDDVSIPIGIKTAQGIQVSFSLENFILPEETEVYLEDRETNTFTLLNTTSYTFTPNSAMSGTGRFFLRIGSQTLSSNMQDSNDLKLFASKKTIHIKGQLLADTHVSIYDVQGRLVMSSSLDQGTQTNSILAAHLNTGIYLVKLANEKQSQTKKVIIN